MKQTIGMIVSYTAVLVGIFTFAYISVLNRKDIGVGSSKLSLPEPESVIKETDSKELKAAIRIISLLGTEDIDLRGVACMIDDTYTSSFDATREELERCRTESEKIKSSFVSFRNAVGDTDLYDKKEKEVHVVSSIPDGWKSREVSTATVPKELSNWVGKWFFVEDYGILHCLDTNEHDYVLVYGSEDKTFVSGIVLVGKNVLSDEQIREVTEAWNK